MLGPIIPLVLILMMVLSASGIIFGARRGRLAKNKRRLTDPLDEETSE